MSCDPTLTLQSPVRDVFAFTGLTFFLDTKKKVHYAGRSTLSQLLQQSLVDRRYKSLRFGHVTLHKTAKKGIKAPTNLQELRCKCSIIVNRYSTGRCCANDLGSSLEAARYEVLGPVKSLTYEIRKSLGDSKLGVC